MVAPQLDSPDLGLRMRSTLEGELRTASKVGHLLLEGSQKRAALSALRIQRKSVCTNAPNMLEGKHACS